MTPGQACISGFNEQGDVVVFGQPGPPLPSLHELQAAYQQTQDALLRQFSEALHRIKRLQEKNDDLQDQLDVANGVLWSVAGQKQLR